MMSRPQRHVPDAVPPEGGAGSDHLIDRELRESLAALPVLDLADVEGTRRQVQTALECVECVSEPGVEVTRHHVETEGGGPDVEVVLYKPDIGPSGGGPAVLDIHGGGFVTGSVRAQHRQNVFLSRALSAVVVSVDYRLSPESRYPAPLDDCDVAFDWLVFDGPGVGVATDRIALVGTSAGGCLAAALALRRRDRGLPGPCFQMLVTPVLDDRLRTPSMRSFTDTPVWNRRNAELSWDAYLGIGQRGRPDISVYAAPGRATDLAGLPPAYVAVMEFDPLRDEGIAYASALLAAGVSTELHCFPGTFHSSSRLESARVSQREVAERVAVLKSVLNTA